MKTIKILMTVSLVTLLLSGCSKEFLNRKPTNQIATSELTDPKYAPQLFNGAWRYFNDTYFTYANPGFSTFMRINDAMANDVVAMTGKYGFLSVYQFSDIHNDNIYRTRSMWTLLYKTIDNCNAAIKVAGDDESVKTAKGQALVLRAFCYFTLVQHYALNYMVDKNVKVVPVYTEPTDNNTVPKAKSTVEQVYAQIESDLNAAALLLKSFNRGSEKYRPNTQVIHGLKARIALVKNDWAAADSNAKQAIVGFPLMSKADYVGGFNDVSNPEWIWGHPQTNDQASASYSFHYMDVVSTQSYYYSFMCDPNFMQYYTDPNDVRLSMFEWVRDGYLAYKKFLFKPGLTQADIVYMRASEMHLIQAEALAQQDNLTSAATSLSNVLLARGAQAYSATGKSKEQVLEDIYIERRKELWGEGFGLSDLLRLQKPIVRVNTFTATDTVSCRQIPKPSSGAEYKFFAKKGHHVLTFPGNAPFVANDPMMVFAISDAEKLANPNLNK